MAIPRDGVSVITASGISNMEAMESGEEFEDSQSMPRKRGRKRKERAKESSKSSLSGAPRTRSQVALDWTAQELLILVNEISAVEGDCLKALSSYQKWKIIVDNCAALGVPRTLNQCRSKWNSLVAEYNQIKQWDSNSNSDSYWVLDFKQRKLSQLPENFDNDLFIAIDNYVTAQKDHLDTDPDSDAEAEADLLNVIAKLGFKPHRRTSMSLKIQSEENQNCCAMEQNEEIHGEVEPERSCEEVNPQTCSEKEMPLVLYDEKELWESHLEEKSQESCRKEKPQITNVAEEPQQSLVEERPKIRRGRKKKIIGTEEEKQMAGREKPKIRCGGRKNITGEEEENQMAVEEKPKIRRGRRKKIMGQEEEKQMAVQKLRQNAELIHAIAQGNFAERADFVANDVKSVQDFQIDFARRQGDKLVACLRDTVEILDEYPDLVRDCVKFSRQSDWLVQ